MLYEIDACPECGSTGPFVAENRDSGWPAQRNAFGEWIVCESCGCEEPPPEPPDEFGHTRHYEVHADHGIVQAWSTARLQFDPQGWQRELRDEIRHAVPGLDPRPGRCLHAVYSSPAADACDIENILLYNIGPGTFAHLARHALLLERSWLRPRCPEALLGPPRHHVAYSVSTDTQFRHWETGPVLATASAHLPHLTSTTKPASVWLAAARGLRSPASLDAAVPPPFILDVQVAAPALASITTVVKPLLDGLISAFHCHEGSDLPMMIPRIASSTGADQAEVASLLTAAKAALGRRRLVWPWRDGVQWNPADDRCVACRITSVTAPTTSVSATLLIAKPVRDATIASVGIR